MTDTARTWYLLRICLVISGLIIIFFSGIFPVENYLALVNPSQLTASVVPSEVAVLTNQNRIDNGLSALTVNPLLTQAAQLKAEDMAQNSYYAHIGPDGKSPLYWLTRVGYKYLNAGENLVIDRTTSEQAVDAWMSSPDHRENILRPQFTEIGVGVASGQYQGVDTIFVVEEFGTPYPLSAPLVQKPVPVVATAPSTPVVKPIPVVVAVATPKRVTDIQPLPTPSIIADVKALVKPLADNIVSTPAQKLTPVLAVKAVKVASSTPATTKSATSTTATSTVMASSTDSTNTATSTASTTTVSYVLAPEFFTPVFSNLHEQIFTTGKETVPETSNPTPTWIDGIRAYLQRITNFVPRIW